MPSLSPAPDGLSDRLLRLPTPRALCPDGESYDSTWPKGHLKQSGYLDEKGELLIREDERPVTAYVDTCSGDLYLHLPNRAIESSTSSAVQIKEIE
jgi:hypothetical protein